MRDSQPFIENSDGGTLALAIVDTVREPLLVLDKDLRVLAASRSFYRTFKVAPSITQGQLIYGWATDNGIFPNSGYCWKGSFRSTA
jgi:hypothetical protein